MKKISSLVFLGVFIILASCNSNSSHTNNADPWKSYSNKSKIHTVETLLRGSSKLMNELVIIEGEVDYNCCDKRAIPEANFTEYINDQGEVYTVNFIFKENEQVIVNSIQPKSIVKIGGVLESIKLVDNISDYGVKEYIVTINNCRKL
jgi:hypothetical protein